MIKTLKKIWNFEFSSESFLVKLMIPLTILLGAGYVALEVLLGQHPEANQVSVFHSESISKAINKSSGSNEWFVNHFAEIWIAVAVLCFVVRFAVIIHSFFQSKKVFGEKKFSRYFLNYSMSFILSLFFGLFVLMLLAFVLKLFGVENSVNVFQWFALKMKAFFTNNIPNIIEINSYWLALILSIFLVSLPDHFFHWFSHKSRFLWYVFHRAHHCPEILHPMAAPPAYVFDFFVIIPYVFVGSIISSLIYTESLVLELSLWFMLGYFMEIFNHSSVHYHFALKNPIVRNLSRIFGGKGVYHLVHHSAYEQDQEVNFSAAPFSFWDRVFGTYRKPYESIPDLGLTHQPAIKLSPFRIIFSGVFQLGYEFFHNKGFATKWKIIFGSIHYQAPISKDYLKV